MNGLDADGWSVVSAFLKSVSARRALALVCHAAREGVRTETYSAPLRMVNDYMLQKHVAFYLCVDGKFCREKMTFDCNLEAGCFNHTYNSNEIVRAFGGWKGISEALHKRLCLNYQHRELNKRRGVASKARRDKLDAWLAKKQPFGKVLVSIDKIKRALHHRRPRGLPLEFNGVIGAFLADTMRAPALKQVKSALTEHVRVHLHAPQNALAAFVNVQYDI